MKLHYFVREYSEGESFPEVTIFKTEEEARAAMIAAAAKAAEDLDGWMTVDIDGPDATEYLLGGHLATTVSEINVELPGGAFDCFKLMSQDVAM